MSYATIIGQCINCRQLITYHPLKVPSLRVNGVRQPICETCFHRWNQIHRVRKGLAPLPLEPEAYAPCDERELPSDE